MVKRIAKTHNLLIRPCDNLHNQYVCVLLLQLHNWLYQTPIMLLIQFSNSHQLPLAVTSINHVLNLVSDLCNDPQKPQKKADLYF